MIYRYRCIKRLPRYGTDADGRASKCGGRRSLKKLIDFYVVRPKCPRCRSDGLTLDKHRMRKEVGKGADTCMCDGLHFPHRRGSMWCCEYKGEYSDDDLQWGPPI